MAKKAKRDYSKDNREFLARVSKEEGITELAGGVLYRVISSMKNAPERKPTMQDVVCVNYIGKLYNGRVFDSSYDNGYPEAFRLREVVEGWQIALQEMRVGDKWEIFIPSALGYGIRTNGDIPGGSTLVFEVELLSIT